MKYPISTAILLLAPAAALANDIPVGIPEPSEFALLSVGAAVAALVAWRKKAK